MSSRGRLALLVHLQLRMAQAPESQQEMESSQKVPSNNHKSGKQIAETHLLLTRGSVCLIVITLQQFSTWWTSSSAWWRSLETFNPKASWSIHTRNNGLCWMLVVFGLTTWLVVSSVALLNAWVNTLVEGCDSAKMLRVRWRLSEDSKLQRGRL